MKMSVLYDQILYFEDAIESPETLVSRIENCDAVDWQRWLDVESNFAYGETKKFLPEDAGDSVQDLRHDISDVFIKCATIHSGYSAMGEEEFDFAIEGIQNATFGVNKYFEGKAMGPHVDRNDLNLGAHYVVIAYLNDDYSGGEIVFIDQGVKIKPKAGSVLIFPGTKPYVHEILPIQNGRKMLITHHLNTDFMKERKVKLGGRLHENVYYYKNVIEDPQTLVDMIEKYNSVESIHPVIPKWNDWLSNSYDGTVFGVKKDFSLNNLDQLSKEDRDTAEFLITTIRNGVRDVAEKFVKDRGLDIEMNISPFVGVSKYMEGCFMGAHFDAQGGDKSLFWSIVLYLNDNYEGGEISFVLRDNDLRLPENDIYRPKEDIEAPENGDLIDFWLKPEAGSALIFPSTEPYRHQVHLMKSGQKYIFPGFIFVAGYDPSDPEHRKQYRGDT